MFHYISGPISFKTPTYVVIDCNGVGYELNISLHTYGRIAQARECRLYTYFHVREDVQILYGFADEDEKNLFVQLISVSGVGPNTARMILSSYPPDDLKRAIVGGNAGIIQSIKGIGPKTAQRLILELKDKIRKDIGEVPIIIEQDNTLRQEALSALVMLGFSKPEAEKSVLKALRTQPSPSKVEDLIKEALKN